MRELKPWEERFVKEYWELDDRVNKLCSMLTKWGKGELDFEPKCPETLLFAQYNIMMAYLSILEERADIEGVPLFEEEDKTHFCYECAHSIITVHDCGTADRGYQLCAKRCPKLDPAYCGHFTAREVK